MDHNHPYENILFEALRVLDHEYSRELAAVQPSGLLRRLGVFLRRQKPSLEPLFTDEGCSQPTMAGEECA